VNAEFWKSKIEHNMSRDAKIVRRLRADGWGVMTVWECRLAPTKVSALAKRVSMFLCG
jgi:DNA mismatch endonuclease, patch repair protein